MTQQHQSSDIEKIRRSMHRLVKRQCAQFETNFHRNVDLFVDNLIERLVFVRDSNPPVTPASQGSSGGHAVDPLPVEVTTESQADDPVELDPNLLSLFSLAAKDQAVRRPFE